MTDKELGNEIAELIKSYAKARNHLLENSDLNAVSELNKDRVVSALKLADLAVGLGLLKIN